MIVIDDFFPDFQKVRDFAETCQLVDGVGPDGHPYYNMGMLTDTLTRQVIYGARKAIGRAFMPFAAIRVSPEGVKAAYKAHTDSFMTADKSMVCYVNLAEHCQGGTSFLRYKDGTERSKGKNEEAHWWNDRNNQDAWEKIETVEMKPNRAIFFDSDRIHQSEPVGGFGSNRHDSRAVIIAFFKQ